MNVLLTHSLTHSLPYLLAKVVEACHKTDQRVVDIIVVSARQTSTAWYTSPPSIASSDRQRLLSLAAAADAAVSLRRPVDRRRRGRRLLVVGRLLRGLGDRSTANAATFLHGTDTVSGGVLGPRAPRWSGLAPAGRVEASIRQVAVPRLPPAVSRRLHLHLCHRCKQKLLYAFMLSRF